MYMQNFNFLFNEMAELNNTKVADGSLLPEIVQETINIIHVYVAMMYNNIN